MAVSDQAAEPIVGFPPPGGWPFPIPNTGPGGGLPHENYGPQLNFTIWLLTILASGFLGLRVYCKFLRHRGLWWDDHVLIAAWVRSDLRERHSGDGECDANALLRRPL